MPEGQRGLVVIGVVGGIASGKSSVARVLGEQGAAVLDADAAARDALDHPEVVEHLVARHGPDLIDRSGRIDRQALAKRVFGRDEELSHLERLVHPHVTAEIEARLAAFRRSGRRAVVLDVPLLLETGGFAARCDRLIFVESPLAERRRRAMAARGWDASELTRREAHQLPPEEKRRRADVVIVNDAGEAELRARVLAWLAAEGGFAGVARRAPDAPTDSSHGGSDPD